LAEHQLYLILMSLVIPTLHSTLEIVFDHRLFRTITESHIDPLIREYELSSCHVVQD